MFGVFPFGVPYFGQPQLVAIASPPGAVDIDGSGAGETVVAIGDGAGPMILEYAGAMDTPVTAAGALVSTVRGAGARR